MDKFAKLTHSSAHGAGLLFKSFYICRMTDYLILKISEMALRAIRAPSGPLWKFMIQNEFGIYLYDQYPNHITPEYCGFPHGTLQMHYFTGSILVMEYFNLTRAYRNIRYL